MKRRYSILSIIGKNSKIRFPRHIDLTVTDTLSFVLPANELLAEAPLSTALAMVKADAGEFCDAFNDESLDHDEGLPLNTFIYISSGNFIFEIHSPTVYSLFNIVFDLEDLGIERFRDFEDVVLLTLFNFSIIKINPSTDFFKNEIYTTAKTIYGSLVSYNMKRNFPLRIYTKHRRINKRYFLNLPSLVIKRKLYLRNLRLFSYNSGYIKKNRILFNFISQLNLYESFVDSFLLNDIDHNGNIINL